MSPGPRPSTGWINSVIAATSEQLADTDVLIRTWLMLAHVLHVDETAVNVNGHRWWLHVAATQKLTSYFLHKSRGRTAVAEFAILPAFTKVCVHDALSVYDCPDYARASKRSVGRTSPGNSSPPSKPTPTTPGRRRRWMRSTSSTPPPTGRGRRI